MLDGDYLKQIQRAVDFIEVNLGSRDVEEIFASLKSTGNQSIRYETLHRKKDGTMLAVEISLQYVKTSHGDPVFVI